MDRSKEAIVIFDKYAQAYQDKYMDIGRYAPTLNLFCQAMHQHAEVLEIGCGPGNVIKHQLDRRPDLRITGIDLSANMLALAQQNCPTAGFLLWDARRIRELQKKYDGVVAAFCLPYLTKDESIRLIEDIAQILNPGGLVYLSTMEDDYTKSGYEYPSSGEGDRMYIHYHQSDYLLAVLQANGLAVIDVQRVEQEDGKGNDLIILAGE